ncbi:hypothetical protein HMF3257_20020 [Spirosoma telluris]|uniref:Uncharacterized protein n=1 Tax=Spirosoma telluris TaxID=2183553 RepID=A0A327NNB4_9BACT|nr:hypothetical protein HMF3257_20020 [Spirosoma telluris]
MALISAGSYAFIWPRFILGTTIPFTTKASGVSVMVGMLLVVIALLGSGRIYNRKGFGFVTRSLCHFNEFDLLTRKRQKRYGMVTKLQNRGIDTE